MGIWRGCEDIRSVPGGSQYLWWGSLGSKDWWAPKGGFATLSRSSPHGVIGSCSGLPPLGSDGSQLVPPGFMAQFPERSGAREEAWAAREFASCCGTAVCASRARVEHSKPTKTAKLLGKLIWQFRIV